MAVTHLAPGKITPILYFINAQGYVKMMPTDEESKRFRRHMGKLGFELQEADTLQAADKLQSKMQEQLRIEQEIELAQDEETTRYRRQQVRDRLVRRMNSSACPAVERDFIQAWLIIREQKHDIFKKRFTNQVGHLDALGYDNPNKHIEDILNRG